MGAALKVPANQWKCHYEPVLGRELQAHVELVFKYFAIEAVEKSKQSDLFFQSKNVSLPKYGEI